LKPVLDFQIVISQVRERWTRKNPEGTHARNMLFADRLHMAVGSKSLKMN
jgi:hypothetical protein